MGKTNIIFHDRITRIGHSAFAFCDNLFTTIQLPSSIQFIGESAFGFTRSLTGINIPKGVGYVGKAAFYGSGSYYGLTIYSELQQPQQDGRGRWIVDGWDIDWMNANDSNITVIWDSNGSMR
jgi:hypothetical protein